MPSLVLASSSPYRKALLERLGFEFISVSPNIDESALANESAKDLVQRLAVAKAQALSTNFPNHLIIGSDQVATLGTSILGKPHTHNAATQQLQSSSGNKVIFSTGLCLLNSATGRQQVSYEDFTVYFRHLTIEQIESYLIKEQPYDCAGSFKSEGLGIALFERLEGRDPNTLIGLPLILLVDMLQREGLDPLLPRTMQACSN